MNGTNRYSLRPCVLYGCAVGLFVVLVALGVAQLLDPALSAALRHSGDAPGLVWALCQGAAVAGTMCEGPYHAATEEGHG
jgi:hypothetical protein